MIDWRQTARSLMLIAVACSATVLFAHRQLSTALVARGDALAYAGSAHALDIYRRALTFDATNTVAVDRLAFRALLSHDRAEMSEAVRMTSAVLRFRADASEVRMDRALCLQLLGRYAAALSDFESAGVSQRDPRALLFAADDARKLHRNAQAHRLLLAALVVDPHFGPARLALAREKGTR